MRVFHNYVHFDDYVTFWACVKCDEIFSDSQDMVKHIEETKHKGSVLFGQGGLRPVGKLSDEFKQNAKKSFVYSYVKKWGRFE